MLDQRHKLGNEKIGYKKFIIGVVLGLSLFGIGFFLLKPLSDDGKKELQDVLQKNNIIRNPQSPEPYIYKYIEAPPSSWGFSNGTIRVVNLSFFWSFFENYSHWKLEYTSKLGDSWTDVTTEALVFETIRMGDYEKQNVNFTAPFTGYYRLNYSINATITDYEFNGTHHEYSLNVSIPDTAGEFYWVYYNWSDIVQSGWDQYIVYNHGVTQDSHFYLEVFIDSKISKNSFLSLDPTFGNTGTSVDKEILTDVIKGTVHAAPADGTITSMSMYVDEDAGGSCVGKMAYYFLDNLTLAGYTNEGDMADGWIELSMASGGNIIGGTDYILMGWANLDGKKNTYIFYTDTSSISKLQAKTYDGTFPNPLVPDTTQSFNYCIYATYTAVSPTQDGEVPNDGATQQVLNPSMNITVDDPNDDTLTAYWLSNSSGSWLEFARNTSINTGSGAVSIEQVPVNFTSYNKKYYWNVSVTDGTFYSNETYNFTTEMMTPEISDEIPVNQSTDIGITPTVNVTVWDNSTNPDDLTVEFWDNTSQNYRVYICDDIDAQAWEGDTTSIGTFDDDDKEFTSNNYTAISVDDANYVFDSISLGRCQYHRFNFTIDEDEAILDFLNITYKGYGNIEEGTSNHTYLYIYNQTASGWILFNEHTENSTQSLCINLSSNITDFISNTGHLECGIYGPDSASDHCQLFSYYIEVNVTNSDEGLWYLQQTNESVSSGDSVEWVYTNASEYETAYYWKVIVNNSQKTNGSDYWYKFTTEEEVVGEQWQEISSSVNGSAYNLTVWVELDSTKNGSAYNLTVWKEIDSTINGTAYHVKTWYEVDSSINGSAYNQTVWTMIDSAINGTCYNTTLWQPISWDINGTCYNTTNWYEISSSVNGTAYNLTGWTRIDSSVNGSAFNQTVWTEISSNINGTAYNISLESWQTIDYSINGTCYNLTSWQPISWDINGTCYNTTLWQTIDYAINGSAWNGTSWNGISWNINGSCYNTTIWKEIDSSINGTAYNTSIESWQEINSSVNGTCYNTTIWQSIDYSINGTCYNTTVWNEIDSAINGTAYNTTVWQPVSWDINGSAYNSTIWKEIDSSINGTCYNTSIETWQLINLDTNGTCYNTTVWTIIDSAINGSCYNTTTWQTIDYIINGTAYNLTDWTEISSSINGTAYNVTIWTEISSDINGSCWNISIDWTMITTLNGTAYNTSLWAEISSNINGTCWNTSVPATISITNIYPSNNSYNNPLQPYLYATFISGIGADLNVTWYYGFSQDNATILLGTDVDISNETLTKAFAQASNYSTRYYWRVYVEDLFGHSLNETLNFKTELQHEGGIPSNRLYNYILIAIAVSLCMVILFNGRRRNRTVVVYEEDLDEYV